tara:strand:+ start:1646 stop:2284 length:639 start_codon:yes stop_codon:yes gene_type:complete
MPITINGDGSIAGLSVGGLPNGSVDADTLASNAVTSAKLASGSVSSAKLASGAISASTLPAGSIVQVQFTTSTAGKGTSSAGQHASGLVTTLTPARAGSKFFVTASGMSMHNNAGASNQGSRFWLYASVAGGSYTNVTDTWVQSCQRSGGSWTDFPGNLSFPCTVSYSLGQTVSFQIFYGYGLNASSSTYFHHNGASGNGTRYQQTVMEIAA